MPKKYTVEIDGEELSFSEDELKKLKKSSKPSKSDDPPSESKLPKGFKTNKPEITPQMFYQMLSEDPIAAINFAVDKGSSEVIQGLKAANQALGQQIIEISLEPALSNVDGDVTKARQALGDWWKKEENKNLLVTPGNARKGLEDLAKDKKVSLKSETPKAAVPKSKEKEKQEPEVAPEFLASLQTEEEGKILTQEELNEKVQKIQEEQGAEGAMRFLSELKKTAVQDGEVGVPMMGV